MSDLFLTFIYIRGAALLVEAAEMGNPDALYELGARLRVEVGLSSFQRQFFLRPMFCTLSSSTYLFYL